MDKIDNTHFTDVHIPTLIDMNDFVRITYFYYGDCDSRDIEQFKLDSEPTAEKIHTISFDSIAGCNKEKIICEFKKINWEKFTILTGLNIDFRLIYLIDFMPEKIKNVCLICEHCCSTDIDKLIETEIHEKINRIKIGRDDMYDTSVADKFNLKVSVFMSKLPPSVDSVYIQLFSMNADSFSRLDFSSLPFSLKKLYVHASIEFDEMPSFITDDDLVEKFRKIFTPMPTTELIRLNICGKSTWRRIYNKVVAYKDGETKIEN